MAETTHRRSAEIIQFPTGERGNITTRAPQVAPVFDDATEAETPVASSGAWYHEEALQEPTSSKH